MIKGVCEHGLLKRSCEICELNNTISHLEKENQMLYGVLNQVEDLLQKVRKEAN